jgi:hypothetical protein
MVTRVRAVRRGPITGRPFDCVVSTGDNIDNQQLNEARWFVRLLDGGRLRPGSGSRGGYEGVQQVAGGGHEVRTGNDDRLVLVFSHFPWSSMNSAITDPERPDERRVLGPEVVDLLHRFPNVVAWVNGHHHVNRVAPLPDPAGRSGGFWDVNTASHVDHPQHARTVEPVDNGDGTLSIFCTMLEHAAPARVGYDATSTAALASISRELSANDPQSDRADRRGGAADLNVELVLDAPFDLAAAGIG